MQQLKHFMSWLWVWFNQKRRVAAQGLVEYALMLVLIAVVVVGALSLVGSATNDKLSAVTCNVEGAGTGSIPNCP